MFKFRYVGIHPCLNITGQVTDGINICEWRSELLIWRVLHSYIPDSRETWAKGRGRAQDPAVQAQGY